MKTKDMRQRLGRKSVVSTESNNGIDGLPFVAEVKSEEPESTVVDRVIDPPELLTELDDALKDIDIHISSMEALLAVSDTVQFASDHPTTSLESAVVEFLSKRLANPHAGQQMVSSTITGQLRCGADIVTFEEIATNAARSHWTSINNRINKLAQKTGALSDTTAEVGKRISEQFKTLKSQVWGYKGGNSIKVGNLVADGNTLAKAILSTQQAIALDMGLKSTLPLDRLVDNLAIKASKIIGSGKSDQLTNLSSTAVQQAQQLSNGYNAYANNDNILGFVRTGMDDELTLPQGIVSALTGAERKYNFPRYKRITSGGAKGEVELTPQLAKQLYDLGMNISRDMTEQSRAWDLRMGTLKGLGELAKTQAENIDADKNTWAAESRAASNILTMWITNTSARRYYISVYNKLASHILDILNNATVTKGTVSKEEYSQELFGFGKPKVLDMKQAISFINSNIGKVTPKTVEVETSDLGNTSDVKHITSFLDSTLKETSALISQAIPCFKQALQYMSRFEEDDDEDALDSDMLKALTPFIKYVGKGRVISHYSVSAVELRDGSYRIDGVYDNTEKHDTGVDIDSGGIRELLSYVNSTDALLQELRKVAWLDYGQSYCDWPYGIRVMLESIQRSLITICLKAIGDKVTVSQELFGFGKPKAVPLTDAISFVNTNMGKVKSANVSLNVGLFGNVNDLAQLSNAVSKIISPIEQFVKLAKDSYDEGYLRMQEYEENDDDYGMDEALKRDFKKLTQWIGSGKVFHTVTINANIERLSIGGTYTKPQVRNIEITLDPASVKQLMDIVNVLERTIKSVMDLGYLEYAQSLCDWQMEIREMLLDMQHALVTSCLKAIGDKVTISQELFGWGKKKEAPKPNSSTPQAEVYRTPKELIDLMQSAQFDRCDPQVSLSMPGYNADFAKHCQLALQAYTEYKKHYTERRYNEFVQTVNSLIDDVYNRNIESDQAISEDWKEQANGILKEISAKLIEDGVYLKFWGMTRIANGARTNFALQPNMEVGIGGYDEIPNPKLTKLQIGNVDDRVALDFLRATQDIEVWPVPKAIDSNRFIKTFSHYDDALFMSVYEAISTINQNMDNLLSFTHDLISKSIVLKDTE